MIIKGRKKLYGEMEIPGDKSISHRALIFSSLAKEEISVENILISEDTLDTIDCFRQLGINIEVYKEDKKAIIKGRGLRGLKKPKKPLYCGNSGTTMRLLAGILAGQDFSSTLTGDSSLSTRPMERIILPLSKMGASIRGDKDSLPPLKIQPVEKLKGIEYTLPVASAQVKSAILLASLYAEGEIKLVEPRVTRDHTERMMEFFEGKDPSDRSIYVPGDISSAAFFMVGASIIEGSDLVLKNIGINPSRTGILDVMKDMGANIRIENTRTINNEPMGDIYVRYSELKGIELDKDIMGRVIDEIPIIAVAAAFAKGTTIIKGAGELRHKETDRIEAMVEGLKNLGGDIEALEDGLIIRGRDKLYPGIVKSYDDHRIAMALSIAALNIEGSSEIKNSQCVNISYPNFYNMI